MRYFTLLLVALLLYSCTPKENEKNEDKKKENTKIKPASAYFPAEKVQVLIVGTFHFDYPGLDSFKTLPEDKIDVLKEPKKTEVTELIDYIKKFKPNKIAIEARSNWNATQRLTKYKAGDYRDQRDERYQIAMRIADEIKLDTLYAIDARSMSEDIEEIDSTYTQKLFKDYDFEHEDPYRQMTQDWYEGESKLVSQVNLLEYFKHINSRESHQYGYGAYLVGDFKLDNERGADILSFWWYNRNVRIFRKLQKITESEHDRILIVAGNGHAAVLRQLLEASPEYEFVEFDSL